MTALAPQLLLVEDNEDDVFLMRRALKAAEVSLPLYVAGDGQEALEYLQGAGKYADRAQFPVPDLVFLDLKLPYVHGFQVLEWIRANSPKLPVVVLTSSPEERDRGKAEQLGARDYLVKPPTAKMIERTLHYLPDFNLK